MPVRLTEEKDINIVIVLRTPSRSIWSFFCFISTFFIPRILQDIQKWLQIRKRTGKSKGRTRVRRQRVKL